LASHDGQQVSVVGVDRGEGADDYGSIRESRLLAEQPVPPPRSYCTRPAHWTVCACELLPELPPYTWQDHEHFGRPVYDARRRLRAHVVEVAPEEEEFATIAREFIGTPYEVTCVARVQNERCRDRYQFERQQMCDDAAGSPPLEATSLYHVTKWHNLDTVYADGLDQRMAAHGMFGRGIYLSDDPVKCNKYWRGADVSGMRFMLRCRALLGNVKQYPLGIPDRYLTTEPPGYDSVQGNMTGHNEYVLYSNNQVLIEYVIGYAPWTPVVSPQQEQ